MNGITGVPGATAADIAATGTSMVAMNVLKSTQSFMSEEVWRLFASFGVGTNINTSA